MSSVLPVCLEVGRDYRPKAEYSFRMLLAPLGLGPVFVSRSEIAEQGIYYGQNPSGLHEGITALPLVPETEDFYSKFVPLDQASITWHNHQNFEIPVLFSSEAGYDLIASAFYWLSGWQELTVRTRDQFGRFPHEASLQASLNVTHIPVVDCYRAILQERLVKARIPVQPRSWAGKSWAFCPTIDVDYLRHWRPGMIFREKVEYFLLNHRKVTVPARWRRLFQFVRSYCTPGDAFQIALRRMHQLLRKHGSATVFLKTAAHGPYDVYYRPDQPFLRNMVRDLQSDNFEIGLHPSYLAHAHPGYLRSERRTLAALTGVFPMSVRQHYLRYEPMITPQTQAGSGFRIDSSLGFAECEGFRNGTCMPFLKFDCITNKAIDLWEMPLVIMDGTLFNRRSYTTAEAVQKSTELLELCKKFGGAGVVLWHNVIGENMDYPGWEDHFEQIVHWSSEQDAWIGSLRDALASWTGYPLANH